MASDLPRRETGLYGIGEGAAINPISKTNRERTGVAPDVAVPADQGFDEA
jgi:hypothetical protein